jgi:hypothetical protein
MPRGRCPAAASLFLQNNRKEPLLVYQMQFISSVILSAAQDDKHEIDYETRLIRKIR